MSPVTIVIPFYNNCGCIGPLMRELASYHRKEWNFIFVDDASTDDTLSELKKFALLLPDRTVQIIENKWNVGSHLAVRRGAARVGKGIVIVMAGDGQDDPAHIEALIAILNEGNEIALTVSNTDDTSLFARIFHGAMCLITPKIKELTVTRTWYMLAADVELFRIAAITQKRHLYYDLIGRSRKVAALAVNRRKRTSGHSQWGTQKKLRFALGWLWSQAQP
jgi:glycosyltransferase involved in cell wall biosynthesis